MKTTSEDMANSQQFSLRWNNYLSHITGAFDSLRADEDFVDCTLSCEGKKIKAHKMLLSACSSYFRDIFKENPCQHPVIIFRNVKFEDLESIVKFMYQGEVNVAQESLSSFLNTAELLEVQGLTTNKAHPYDTNNGDDIEGALSGGEEKPVKKHNSKSVSPVHTTYPDSPPASGGKKRKVVIPSPLDEGKLKSEPEYFDNDSMETYDDPNEHLSQDLSDRLYPGPSDDSVEDPGPGTSNDNTLQDSLQVPVFVFPSLLKSRVEHTLEETTQRCKKNRKLRRRCVYCYKKRSCTLGDKVATRDVKKVTTYCTACERFICSKCFKIHLDDVVANT